MLLFPNLFLTQVVNVEGMRQSHEKGWSGTTEFLFDYNDSEQIDYIIESVEDEWGYNDKILAQKLKKKYKK